MYRINFLTRASNCWYIGASGTVLRVLGSALPGRHSGRRAVVEVAGVVGAEGEEVEIEGVRALGVVGQLAVFPLLFRLFRGSRPVFLSGLRDLSPKANAFFDVKIGIVQTLSKKLGISKNAAKSFTEGRMLNIPRLINQFREPVPRNRVHETQGFVRRNFVEVYGTEELWVQRFHQATEEVIAWQTNWADLPIVALSNMGRSRMMLVGMTGWTFYIPYRILHQLGIRQSMPLHDYFSMPYFKFYTCNFYQRTWGARVTIPRDPYPSVLLPQNYESWLIQDVEARVGWNEG
ncbi:hypothetical protein RHSIM_Rhsim07G0153600 [Rhododendron simsii]|uniref:Uncharacterized protein n=1 Tax=Rhododendron simsii TaxID=118357 RepID=A0A834GPF1_RHOSS|nr:hypothetical protein RHSIM_Rhsim07G0153600 [Rhododendron simsii]